ncbi:uncharacterized protein LOC113373281 [Ctenocephalides felis]|uniref:uncharacterized protein LOC113373281 n=1 Tax=Ctenocephalides felis TaxID=7515 RepID=UPI000E6E31CC|nr:uncharacterized protein LOC113373281 [Ctenocephalides felis]
MDADFQLIKNDCKPLCLPTDRSSNNMIMAQVLSEADRPLCNAAYREGQLCHVRVRSSTISHSIPRIGLMRRTRTKICRRGRPRPSPPITYHLVALPTTRIGLPLLKDIISFSTAAVYGVRFTARRVSAKWT